jgi:hypothetical protein
MRKPILNVLPTIAICHAVAHSLIAAASYSYGASSASSAAGEERNYKATVAVSATTASY